MSKITIGLAQINVTVGALKANAESIANAARRAARAGAQLIVFPELALSGYPPEDLLLKRHFIADCETTLGRLAEQLPPDAVCLVGSPVAGTERPYNAAVIYQGGKRRGTYRKLLLPNYGVFDEKRVLQPGQRPLGLVVNGCRLAVHICEDSWYPDRLPSQAFAGSGVSAVLNLSSSPYHRAKLDQRVEALRGMADQLHAPVCYCNLVGGQDELVFDGSSLVVEPGGQIAAEGARFEEDLVLYQLPPVPAPEQPGEESVPEWVELNRVAAPSGSRPITFTPLVPALSDAAEVYAALKLGLRDYVDKNGFNQVLIAISGGIDSALVATLAVDALGPDRVVGLTMPSQYSSSGTLNDAQQLADNLGITLKSIPIHDIYAAYEAELLQHWPGLEPDTTEENLQARIRGTLVMALSNKFGWLVLTTGNKSEIATGYCTLYGDMVGGFAVIKDVPKTLVFSLSRWRNDQGDGEKIPATTISRPPSAELRPDQKDEDSLPPYDLLDPVLERYVERDMSAADITADGFEATMVNRVIRLVDLNEYKRRQGAPGIKITPKAFGRDRRLPITNRYREEAR